MFSFELEYHNLCIIQFNIQNHMNVQHFVQIETYLLIQNLNFVLL